MLLKQEENATLKALISLSKQVKKFLKPLA